MARIGLVPGQDFDRGKLSAYDEEALNRVTKLGLMKMVKRVQEQQPIADGSSLAPRSGSWDSGYLLRATTATLGLGGICRLMRSIPLSKKDTGNNDYNGAEHKYVLPFY